MAKSQRFSNKSLSLVDSTQHLSRGSDHLEVDISGGPFQNGLLSQRERVARVDAVLLTSTVNTHLEKWKSEKMCYIMMSRRYVTDIFSLSQEENTLAV